MTNNTLDLVCLKRITLSDPQITKNKVQAQITLTKTDETSESFTLRQTYEHDLVVSYLPVMRLACCMPLLNYGLFTKEIRLQFPLTHADYHLLTKLNTIFSRDIYVNKILRRRADYLLPMYHPNETQVTPQDADPTAQINPLKTTADTSFGIPLNRNRCGLLSSGGKESLLTYGLLKEIGAEVYPLYINESGGHWRTALPAYRYHKTSDPHTRRVWTNVDRFYVFMLDNLACMRKDHRNIHADTYPLRLCIFPYYVFALLPEFLQNKIGNLLIGSEFDDQRMMPEYLGIPHYYGVYDQHQDFDILMNQWYTKRIPGLVQWSAVRNISCLIVERILVKRYPDLASYQRSCHSCHIINNDVLPCGVCSKCMGVLLFLLANHADPMIMNFSAEDVSLFPQRLQQVNLRLDSDEKEHSLHLYHRNAPSPKEKNIQHIEQIHINPLACDPHYIPAQFRDKLYTILTNYTIGFCKLHNTTWAPLKKEQPSILMSDA